MSAPKPTQQQLAEQRRAKRAKRNANKLHGEGGDRASAAQIAAGDDNRIFHSYIVGKRDATPTPHLVLVNFGVKAACLPEQECRRKIEVALSSFQTATAVSKGEVKPDSAKAGSSSRIIPTFVRVCESKVCFTFSNVTEATHAFNLFNSDVGHQQLGRRVCCAYARSMSHPEPGVCPRPRLAITWEMYTREAVVDSKCCGTAQSRSVPRVPGLMLVLDAVSKEEEHSLLASVEKNGEWSTCARKAARARSGFRMEDHRRVMHFGHAFDYDTRGIGREETEGVLPKFLKELTTRISRYIPPLAGTGPSVTSSSSELPDLLKFDQCTINEYRPGHGIASHVDTHSTFGPTLCSLSLRSQTVMYFVHSVTGARVDLILPARSLLILQRDARYVWTHGIASRTTDLVLVQGKETLVPRSTRLSLTLRRLRDLKNEGPCTCKWPRWCDSAQGTKIIPDLFQTKKPTKKQ